MSLAPLRNGPAGRSAFRCWRQSLLMAPRCCRSAASAPADGTSAAHACSTAAARSASAGGAAHAMPRSAVSLAGVPIAAAR